MADNKKITEFPRSTPSGGFELVAATSAHNYKVSYTDFAEHSALGTKSGIFLDTLSISGFSIGGLPADFAVASLPSNTSQPHSNSFFLTAAGDVYGCGASNSLGLGFLYGINVDVPTYITGLSQGAAVTGISSSHETTLFLTTAGDVYGCGDNSNGELGLGDTVQRWYPTYITGLNEGSAVSVTSSAHGQSFFVSAAGDVYGCGENNHGQLGLGNTVQMEVPTYITGLSQGGSAVTDVSSSEDNTLFLTAAGDAFGCGWNLNGELGIPGTTWLPIYITGLSQGSAVTDISSSYANSLFLTTAGDVYGCGRNSFLQLGLGDAIGRVVPTYITGLNEGSAVTDISNSRRQSIFLTTAGDVYGCGLNRFFQLGLGDQSPRPYPTYITGSSQGSAVAGISPAYDHTLFLTTAGDVYGCGENSREQLGLGVGSLTGYFVPTYISGAGSTPTPADEDIWEEWSDVPASIVSPGSSGDIAFDEDYFYICTSGAREHHITVAVADLTLSDNDSLFLTPSGDVYGCGLNYAGELGVGGTPGAAPVGTPQPYPVYITGLNEGSAVTAFSAATSNCFFLTAAGDVYGCGNDYFGQLGLAIDNIGRAYPTHIIGPLNGDPAVTGVFNSEQNSFFLTAAGDALGCGRNNEGQLGVGDKTWRNVPTHITGSAQGTAVTGISSSLNNTLFLNTAGDVYGCGLNDHGQLALRPPLYPLGAISPLVPMYITGLAGGSAVTGVWSSLNNTLFLDTAGEVYGVGRNQYGELGIGHTNTWDLKHVTGSVAAIRMGDENTLFLTTAGDVYGCGRNFHYPLGLGFGHTMQTVWPTYITGSAVTDISQAGYNSLFLTAAGDAYGCGYNLRDQLGLGDQTVKYAPTHMSGAGSTPIGGPWRRAPLSSF
jgi:alpha-tubulin suppressor-like RCC1 family protein